MSRVFFGFLVRRYRVALLLCMLVPLVLGLASGALFTSYQRDWPMLRMLTMMSVWMGGDVPREFPLAMHFTMSFWHPLSMTVLVLAGALAPLAVPAADRGQGSLDLLLATPLERGRMVRTVFVFTLACAPVLGAAPLAGAWLGAATQGVAGDLPMGAFLLASLDAAALVVCVGCLALLVSVMARDRGQATIWFIALISVFVVLDIGSTMLRAEDWIAWLHWLTPTGYYRPRDLALGRGNAPRDIAVLLGLGVVLAAVAWRLQIRRRSA